jgi:hypothetical protein
MSHDIVDDSRLRTALGTEWLVVASGIEGELTVESAVLVDHADVSPGHEQRDACADIVPAHADVAEAAQVTKGHAPYLVHRVAADAEVRGRMGCFGTCLEASVEGHQRRLVVDGAVGSVVVVVGAERVELELERGGSPPS